MEKKTKKHYYAFAINDQGASLDVCHATSIAECAREARRTLGSGWTVKIMDAEYQSLVKQFKIR